MLVIALVVAGCGTSKELPKQADEAGSIAAEGSLLVHDATQGSTTGVFTRGHAEAAVVGFGRPEMRPET